jgi:hypothetical protein
MTMTDQIPACFSVSYFNPGEGECAVGCRLAERCKPAYLAQARELLAANPSGLTDEEHAFVLEHAFAAAPAKPARKRRSPRLKVVPADVAPAPAPAAAPTSPADGGSLSDGERARIEALVKQVEATVAGQGAERSATRKSSEPWTDARRRPLSSFKPASVPALAAEVLRAAGRPLHVREVAAEVAKRAAAHGAPLTTKTPAATVGLSLRLVRGVKIVARGTYAWAG